MKRVLLTGVLVCLSTAGFVGTVYSQDTKLSSDMQVLKADKIVWQDHPVFKDVKVCWMLGDPNKENLIVQRSKLPAHYSIPAHTHPYTEMVTVISGTYYNAMSTDPKCTDLPTSVMLKPGDSFILPKGCVHHTWTEDEETIVQVTFIGPTGATFVNPADDPRNAKKEQASK
jgi:quercetin dioxygenase-like cupin family protein